MRYKRSCWVDDGELFTAIEAITESKKKEEAVNNEDAPNIKYYWIWKAVLVSHVDSWFRNIVRILLII